jgi:uncharacterized membrane protein
MYERPTGATEWSQPVKRAYFKPGFDPNAEPGSYFQPRQVPLADRVWNIVIALVLIAYGILGLVLDDMFVPGFHTSIRFHGISAWLTFGALISVATACIAVVVDHYDLRNNERQYDLFRKWCGRVGWSLFIAACTLEVLVTSVPLWKGR